MAWVIGKTTKEEAERLAREGYEVTFPSREAVDKLLGETADSEWHTIDGDTPPANVASLPDKWYGWAMYYVDCNATQVVDL